MSNHVPKKTMDGQYSSIPQFHINYAAIMTFIVLAQCIFYMKIWFALSYMNEYQFSRRVFYELK